MSSGCPAAMALYTCIYMYEFAAIQYIEKVKKQAKTDNFTCLLGEIDKLLSLNIINIVYY